MQNHNFSDSMETQQTPAESNTEKLPANADTPSDKPTTEPILNDDASSVQTDKDNDEDVIMLDTDSTDEESVKTDKPALKSDAKG